MRLQSLPLGLLAVFTLGCAPALSTFQPAHVAKQWHVQAEIGTDFAVPTGTIASTVDAGITLVDAAEKQELTELQKKQLFDAGTALALNPPSPVQHFGVALSVYDNLEVGLRYSISALRLGTRYQILHKEKHGVDWTVGFGVGRYVLEFPLGDFLQIVELEDFVRWQFDFPILFGTKGTWYRVWGGPRFMITKFGTELVMNLPSIPGTFDGKQELASLDGLGFYIGAQGGVAVGYKYVFLGFELTMVELLMGADLDAFGKKALDVDLDSFIIYPGIALMGEF
jgi:hypothetical protein